MDYTVNRYMYNIFIHYTKALVELVQYYVLWWSFYFNSKFTIYLNKKVIKVSLENKQTKPAMT